MKRIPALPERGKPFIICDNLVKIYKVADLEVVALQGLDLEVASGEIMAIIGKLRQWEVDSPQYFGGTGPTKRRHPNGWWFELDQVLRRGPCLV